MFPELFPLGSFLLFILVVLFHVSYFSNFQVMVGSSHLRLWQWDTTRNCVPGGSLSTGRLHFGVLSRELTCMLGGYYSPECRILFFGIIHFFRKDPLAFAWGIDAQLFR